MPTVQDERDTYTLWGWSWTEGTANPAYNSAPGYNVGSPDLHGDTEGDDIWSYLQAYQRRESGRDGYLARATAWRNYFVNSFEGSSERGTDVGFLFDHFYGWGLQDYATAYSDSAAAAEAIAISNALHTWWAAGGRSESGSWPVAGTFPMCVYGHRGPARNLHTAVAIAEATGNANAIELRDRLLDLWLQSPDWDATNGMYWVSSEQMGYYNVQPPLSYAAGDRAVSSFHIGQLCESFYRAWLSPNVSSTRKTALRAKIIAMADYMFHYGLDPEVMYCANELGILGAGGHWWSYSLGLTPPYSGGLFWDGVYTLSIVNMLVMAYKFTGDANYLSGTPATNNYPAKHCFNRGTKSIYGSTSSRECADNVAGHFVDTKFDSSTGNQYLYNNKGEFQYTYLIFENGGVPAIHSELAALAGTMAAGSWATLTCNYPSTLANLLSVGGGKRCTEYADKMAWDAVRRKIYFTGGGHGQEEKTIVYDDATNTWSDLGSPPWYTVNPGNAIHGYEHNTYANGIHYYLQFAGTTLHTRDVETDAWGLLNTDPVYLGSDGAIGSLEWFPTYGSQGSLIIVDGNGDGVWRWRKDTQAWSVIGSPTMGGYHNFGVYSPVRDLMYLGGGGAQVYTLSNNGTITAKTNCPASVGIVSSVSFADPVSGNLVEITNDQTVRVLNPTSNSWSTDTAPPSGFWSDTMYSEGEVMGIAACAIPEYGVTLFLTIAGPTVYVRKGR